LCFGALTLDSGIPIDPSRLLAEPEERAHPLQVLCRVHRAIVPRRSELSHRADVDLLQQPKALRLAPADEPPLEQVLILPNGFRREVPYLLAERMAERVGFNSHVAVFLNIRLFSARRHKISHSG
jgi:hypothetical protein